MRKIPPRRATVICWIPVALGSALSAGCEPEEGNVLATFFLDLLRNAIAAFLF